MLLEIMLLEIKLCQLMADMIKVLKNKQYFEIWNFNKNERFVSYKNGGHFGSFQKQDWLWAS